MGSKGGFTNAPDRGPDPYWTAVGWDGYHGEWDLAVSRMCYQDLYDGSWLGWTVAAAGFDFADEGNPNNVLFYSHKAAPDMSLLVSVPEPASLSLLLIGGMGLLLRRRKRGAP